MSLNFSGVLKRNEKNNYISQVIICFNFYVLKTVNCVSYNNYINILFNDG